MPADCILGPCGSCVSGVQTAVVCHAYTCQCKSHVGQSNSIYERGTTACREEVEPTSDEQPDFLPMFPWYSGTSADMYRTIFGLVVSLKLFLGRFDMRTMQVFASHAF